MPYNKPRYNRRKRRTFKKKANVRRVVNQVLQRKAETKKFPTEVIETSLSSAVTCVVDEVSQVDVGVNDTQRIGTKINPSGFYWNYSLHNNSAVPVYVRMIAYLANGGDFNSTTGQFRLDGTSLDPAVFVAENVRDITAMLNKHDLKILYDKTHRLAGLGDGTGIETIHKKFFKKLVGSRQFDSSSTPDSKNNNLRICMIARTADNDTTAAVVEASYNTIYYFKDY